MYHEITHSLVLVKVTEFNRIAEIKLFKNIVVNSYFIRGSATSVKDQLSFIIVELNTLLEENKWLNITLS